MSPFERELVTKLHTERYKDMYRVQYGISKSMGYAPTPKSSKPDYRPATGPATMYGGGRTVATIKPVRTKGRNMGTPTEVKPKLRHWTVQIIGQEVSTQKFKFKADALLFIATQLEL